MGSDANESSSEEDTGGDPACWAHILDDQAVVEPSESHLARLVRDLADAVIICDPDGRITLWNKAAERVLGWRASEVIGESLDIIIEDRFRRRHWDGYFAVMRTGETSYGDRLLEVPAIHRDGRTISIAFTVSLLYGEDSPRPVGIAAVIRDDTDRRAEILRLRAAQR